MIEEINRANVAAVFGDVFQLLDRGDDEVSEYPIQASEDTKKYLAGELGGNPDDYSEIRLPDNMFIWATTVSYTHLDVYKRQPTNLRLFLDHSWNYVVPDIDLSG